MSKPVIAAALGGMGAFATWRYLRKRKLADDNRKAGKVPIYVMMPLDWMNDDASGLRDEATLRRQAEALKKTGVRGVMADVWWGMCEPMPGQYRFGAAQALCELLRDVGLELQAVMSFHQCGGNVGDAVTIPIPDFALSVAKEKGFLYKSKGGVISTDCLSLSADHEKIFKGPSGTRTALDCYREYMKAFIDAIGSHLGTTVVEMQVGMGPCGELRYPSYMLSNGWNYPGTGICMAYDNGMLKMLQKQTKLKEPPKGFPEDQNSGADAAELFKAKTSGSGEVFRSGDGKAFIEWQTNVLIEHGEAVLKEATAAMAGKWTPEGLCFSVKVSGIHWFCNHPSRAAEVLAGYDSCTSPGACAYHKIAGMLARAAETARRPVLFNFTCLEMNNWSNGMPEAYSAPEDLIAQVRRACVSHNVGLAGENALEFDLATGGWAFDQMKKQLRGWSLGRDRFHGLTILRLNENFVKPASLATLREFVVST